MKKIINPWVDLIDEGYNCFACAPNNPYGLKMEFWEDGDDIVSYWTPGDNYQGWLKTLHGGIQATLIDEMGGWVVARKLQTSGMTTNLNVRYRRPISTGENVTIEARARIREQKKMFVIIDVTLSVKGRVCSEAELTYYCFSKEKATEEFHFRGCEVEK
ncbi:MAG: PaaI family thioesterase [Muribaculaceae bacterium]|nr:PaaI family thioesterase [Muribaculaceae bacterium]